MNNLKINSSVALIIYSGLMVAAYVWSTFYEKAPFLAFATQATLAFVAYMTKRLMQKKGEYNGKVNHHI